MCYVLCCILTKCLIIRLSAQDCNNFVVNIGSVDSQCYNFRFRLMLSRVKLQQDYSQLVQYFVRFSAVGKVVRFVHTGYCAVAWQRIWCERIFMYANICCNCCNEKLCFNTSFKMFQLVLKLASNSNCRLCSDF